VVYKGTGDSILAARLVQAVLGVAVVALIGFVAHRLWGRRVGLAAGALAAVFPPLIVSAVALMSESIYLPLELAAVAAVLLAAQDRQRRWWWLLVSGVSAGLGILARPNGAVLVLGLIALLVTLGLAGRRPHPARQVGWSATQVALGCATVMFSAVAVVAPWVVRDSAAFHELVPVTDIDGFNLAGVYNAQAAHDGYPTHYQWRPPNAVPALAPLFHDRSLDEVGLGDALRTKGMDYVEAHPTAVISASVWDTIRMAELTGLGQSTLTSRDAGFGRTAALLGMLAFWAAAALAVVGLLTRAGRRAPAGLWATPVLFWAVTVPFLGTPRLRAPIDPFVVLAAAVGIVALVDRRGGRSVEAASVNLTGAAGDDHPDRTVIVLDAEPSPTGDDLVPTAGPGVPRA
jgi:hypothetical protein